MDAEWLKYIVASKEIALLLSMTFNGIAIAAVALMWRRYVALEQHCTELLSSTVKELCRFLDKAP